MVRRVDGKSFERLQFSRSDRRLMAIDNRRTSPTLWEVSGDEYMVLQARAGPVDQLKTIDFSPDSRLLAAMSGERATIWESGSGRELGTLSFTNARATWFSADGRSLLTSSDNGLFLCPLNYPPAGNPLRLQPGPVQQLPQAPDELGTMALSLDRSLATIVHHEEVLRVPLAPDCPYDTRPFRVDSHYQRLALHPRAEWMATANVNSGSVHLWNLARAETGDVTVSVNVPSSEYFTFSPDGKWLVTCWLGEFRFYRVGDWSKRAYSIRRKLSSSQQAPVAFTRDGRIAAIAASRYIIQLVRLPPDGLRRPEMISTLESPDHSPLEILAFSPDGRHLAAATINQTVQLWNLARLRNGLAELVLARDWPEYP
jgi:WD40 repeat protein